MCHVLALVCEKKYTLRNVYWVCDVLVECLKP